MAGKHIKAACLAIALGLIAVMFFLATVLNGEIIDSSSPVGAIVLLMIAVAAIVPVFAAHERHN